MKLDVENAKKFEKISFYFASFIRFITVALLFIISAVMVFGVIKTGYDFVTGFNQSPEQLLPNIIVNTVFIIALVEISLMLLAYLRDGRVHVRYIIDTILIVMLSEFIVIWFDDPEPIKIGTLIAVVLLLLCARFAVHRSDTK